LRSRRFLLREAAAKRRRATRYRSGGRKPHPPKFFLFFVIFVIFVNFVVFVVQ